MTTVLAAVDNSAAARPVLTAASALAAVLGAGVQAIYVAGEDGQTARACAESAGVTFYRVSGEPIAEITRRARDDDIVAIAIGARRRLRQRHVGSLARAVATAIDKPVLVVPPESAPAERLHTVLIAMEGTPAKARNVKSVIDIGVGADLDLVVVHVDDELSIPSFSDQAAHETDAYAAEFLARYVHGAPKARLEPRVGIPADEIVAVSDSISADLLALGWPQSADPHRGMIAKEVLDRSHVPVLLVALAGPT